MNNYTNSNETDKYSLMFNRYVNHFNKMYYSGFANAPVRYKNLNACDNPVDRASRTLSATLYDTFLGFGKVIMQKRWLFRR